MSSAGHRSPASGRARPGVTDGPRRLTLRAHDPTAAASALVFGDRGPLLRRRPAPDPATGSTARAGTPDHPLAAPCGPEPACVQTAEDLGRLALPDPALRGPDAGSWTGRTLAAVSTLDPDGLQGWLSDPDARPHGGETLTEMVVRVGEYLALPPDPGPGSELWVVAPLVARALTVAALGAPPALVLGIEVAYGGQVQLAGRGTRWRLQGLYRAGTAAAEGADEAGERRSGRAT